VSRTPDQAAGATAAQVHAVIAAGLVDGSTLAAWRSCPDDLRALGIDGSCLDLDGLADFAGLAEKVRHNQCRSLLQLTFRLLALTGLEIELFRDYASTSLDRRRRGLMSQQSRLDGLLEFVESWAASDDPVRTLVRDIVRHEHALVALAAVARPGGDEEGQRKVTSGQPLAAAGVPAHNGRLLVYRMTCDPAVVAAVLRAREPDLSRIPRRDLTLVYHSAPGWELRVMEVEPAVGHILLLVDGQTDLGGIARLLRIEGPATASLRDALDQLAAAGLLVRRVVEEDRTCG
jgi:hypothetical protein